MADMVQLPDASALGICRSLRSPDQDLTFSASGTLFAWRPAVFRRPTDSPSMTAPLYCSSKVSASVIHTSFITLRTLPVWRHAVIGRIAGFTSLAVPQCCT